MSLGTAKILLTSLIFWKAFVVVMFLNLGYFLFAWQTAGILRVKLNEAMELSQVSQPLISYMHQCTLHMKSTVQ